MNSQPNSDYTIIKAARIFDGTGSKTLKEQAILMDGRQISAIGPSNEITAPAGSKVTV